MVVTVGECPKATWTFMLVSFILICYEAGRIEAQTRRIPNDEMQALGEIAEQLGKKGWNFNLKHCDENLIWQTPIVDSSLMYDSTVNCTCPSDDECHIRAIVLKGQDLSGVLPRSLVKLTYIKYIDLSRNYLSGPLPSEWASIKLEYMSFTVNRLSGTIPTSFGRITTLTNMSIEGNMFNGTIPAELGNLVNLVYLNLKSNNLTGELPKEFNKLRKLRELRLSSNNFNGKLPSFQSLTQLQILELEASGFEGPIPSNISLLHNLTELRISDLNGGASKFPALGNMKAMTKLMLRNCNISGSIPDNLVNLTLRQLDLSYNRLEGNIPNLEGAKNLQYMYLTRNMLTGPIPEWIKSRSNDYRIDLSYNKLSRSVGPSTCRETLNLFGSFSSGNHLDFGCLNSCPTNDLYALHINCGGGKAIIKNTIYEADDEYQGGPANFVQTGPSFIWGFSNTGHFWDASGNASYYIAKNVSVLTMNYSQLYTRDLTKNYSQMFTRAITMDNSQLYTRARVSPLSLTYYGRCLANGSYTVTLHFAEIIFRDNRSFQSLGRRIFDVYIQDELVWKDFDIATVAQGVDKAVLLKFNNIVVKNKTIEIRFYWAGKGTTAVPTSGIYGPLISAISVESNFKPPDQKKKIFIVVGALAFAICLVFMILFILWWKCFPRSITSREQALRGLELQTGLFAFRQIKAATNNFDDNNKIGEGGFGSVYKGILLDGTVIAVKQLSSKSKQGNREFVNEIGMISGLQHPNLARLYGCCIEGNQLLLVYEYMENSSLARALFGECQLKLDWPTRLSICIGIARGLAFLQEESRLKIVHRDIKATNILLDGNLNPKISDFGLAKLTEDENTQISTRIAGTIGYMAPEYALWGILTHKADVYSFGIVALEIVTGKNNMKYHPSENYVGLLDWAFVLQQKGCLMELVDPKLGSNFNNEEAIRMIKVALLCTNPSPALRPAMSAVVSMLEGHDSIQGSIMDPSNYSDAMQLQSSSDDQTLVDSVGTTRNGSSSMYAHDLYPINMDSL
ncbi:putative LRR receptor-like serine/threonine-protein kinase [Camellia lanceoleosa]|uniref:LRR receptor-like serine/threonine-protein kinase n=1 Tax=Camellia lanceoleosa TaxID=1840588 RepID=A0ACC0H0A3_9ERIC|nr:putative LRR receptor-like serine/threonine-protein kinase [Camellia lanceoleosa]